MSQSIKITHRFTGATLYQCALPDEIAAMSYGRQLGYATREAVKARVNLARANLADANLGGARNAPTEASRIDPPEPYEHKPAPERYAARAQRFRERNPDVPVIENLDAKILGIIESGTGALEMCRWHTCETTHCMAGWAIHLAGKAGAALEERVGPAIAGRRLWIAATGRAPHFYATNERALEDLRERAAAVVS